MLRELHITNLAVIRDARIEFVSGLNCFTGATGAGKSLVIGAVELLLGLRSPAEMLRPGVDEGRVSGLFQIDDPDMLRQIEQWTDAPLADDGGELLLTRRLATSGRTSISINGHPITLAMLKQIGQAMVDVQGQHDHQFLLRPGNQLDVLDQFGGLKEQRQKYHVAYRALTEAQKRVAELSGDQTIRRQSLELYQFQADEIDAAALNAIELADLRQRAGVLRNLEKLKLQTATAQAALYESEGSAVERLRGIVAILDDLADLDASLDPLLQIVRGATIQLEDAAIDLSRYLNRLDLDPAELARIEERLNTIGRVLDKYGGSIDAVAEYRKEIGAKIAGLSGSSDELAKLSGRIGAMRREVADLAADLSRRRKEAAGRLARAVRGQLGELGMEKATFEVTIENTTASDGGGEPFTPTGSDVVEFMARTNPGQLELPLRKIASGGELSRLMLALKGILARSDRISVLVFDEIDANVGGRLGSVIGAKLRQLAGHHQVLCITHLPQIAAFAHRHLSVRKQVEGAQTTTVVKSLEGPPRIEELAEMIGGAHVTATTRAQADELLATAAQMEAREKDAGEGASRSKATSPAKRNPAKKKDPLAEARRRRG
jgi:DNA repair protein RecN (Recombination protein N)